MELSVPAPSAPSKGLSGVSDRCSKGFCTKSFLRKIGLACLSRQPLAQEVASNDLRDATGRAVVLQNPLQQDQLEKDQLAASEIFKTFMFKLSLDENELFDQLVSLDCTINNFKVIANQLKSHDMGCAQHESRLLFKYYVGLYFKDIKAFYSLTTESCFFLIEHDVLSKEKLAEMYVHGPEKFQCFTQKTIPSFYKVTRCHTGQDFLKLLEDLYQGSLKADKISLFYHITSYSFQRLMLENFVDISLVECIFISKEHHILSRLNDQIILDILQKKINIDDVAYSDDVSYQVAMGKRCNPAQGAFDMLASEEVKSIMTQFIIHGFQIGVEIECLEDIGMSPATKRAKSKGQKSWVDDGFNFSIDSTIKTLPCQIGREYQTPRLLGDQASLKHLINFCSLLDDRKAYSGDSCDLHVHLGLNASPIKKGELPSFSQVNLIKQILVLYMQVERMGVCFSSASRGYFRMKVYSEVIRQKHVTEHDICQMSFNEITQLFQPRNVSSYENRSTVPINFFDALYKHGTIEFRAHSGTLDSRDVISWLVFLCGLVNVAKTMLEKCAGPRLPDELTTHVLLAHVRWFCDNNRSVISFAGKRLS